MYGNYFMSFHRTMM